MPTQKRGLHCLILALAACAFVSLSTLYRAVRTPSFDYAPNQMPPIEIEEQRLGDGCYHVFVDVGSNIGIHGRFLFEPHIYPKSKSSVKKFAREFGENRDNRDFCVFAFEPNPKFRSRHLNLAAAYKAMGWRYHPLFAGAADRDGNMTFYHTHMEKKEQENGFNGVAPKTLYGTDATPITVQIVRLATWMQKEIRDRKIPRSPFGATSGGPKVVMKLDVEGSEYRVFPDLLMTGAMCDTVHFFMGEFHYNNHNFFPIILTEDGRHSLKKKIEAQRYAGAMLQMVDTSANCMTRYSLDDDETYSQDGMDFPIPPAKKLSNNSTAV